MEVKCRRPTTEKDGCLFLMAVMRQYNFLTNAKN